VGRKYMTCWLRFVNSPFLRVGSHGVLTDLWDCVTTKEYLRANWSLKRRRTIRDTGLLRPQISTTSPSSGAGASRAQAAIFSLSRRRLRGPPSILPLEFISQFSFLVSPISEGLAHPITHRDKPASDHFRVADNPRSDPTVVCVSAASRSQGGRWHSCLLRVVKRS
jgi:hypothetical protein